MAGKDDFYDVIYSQNSPRRNPNPGYDRSEYARQFAESQKHGGGGGYRGYDDPNDRHYQGGPPRGKGYDDYGSKGGGGGGPRSYRDDFREAPKYSDNRAKNGGIDYRNRDFHRDDGADPYNRKGQAPPPERGYRNDMNYGYSSQGRLPSPERSHDHDRGYYGKGRLPSPERDSRSNSRFDNDPRMDGRKSQEPKGAGYTREFEYNKRQWQQNKEESEILENLRLACLRRGTAGIKSFGR